MFVSLLISDIEVFLNLKSKIPKLFLEKTKSVMYDLGYLYLIQSYNILFIVNSLYNNNIKVLIKHTQSANNVPLKFFNNSIKDLGITLTCNLCSNMHIQTICWKAIELLGFIIHISADFQLPTPLNTLFCSLVRPILEYGSILLDLSTPSARNMIERVQRKCLRHAAYKLNVPRLSHEYTPIQRLFSLKSLTGSTYLSFLSNLLSSRIDCPELLSRNSFIAPSRRTRSLVYNSIFHSHS